MSRKGVFYIFTEKPSARRGEEAKSLKKPVEQTKKEPAASYSRTGESRTTLGDGALDFRVRNGNGYDNSSMATGKKPLFSWELKRTATP